MRRTLSVLLVEDEPLIALHLRELLADWGFDAVFWAADLDKAARFLASQTPAFAILDINLGRTLVYPIAADLRDRGVPFIFSTARARADLPTEWRGYPLVGKPLEPALLLATISSLGFNTVPRAASHALQMA